jgi:hypothetical protein
MFPDLTPVLLGWLGVYEVRRALVRYLGELLSWSLASRAEGPMMSSLTLLRPQDKTSMVKPPLP